jgi:hypothetical protein
MFNGVEEMAVTDCHKPPMPDTGLETHKSIPTEAATKFYNLFL